MLLVQLFSAQRGLCSLGLLPLRISLEIRAGILGRLPQMHSWNLPVVQVHLAGIRESLPKTQSKNMNTILQSYIECALWSSTDDEGNPLDATYGPEDLHETALREMRLDVDAFTADNSDVLQASNLTDEQIGHDFWLTRNGHGAGFWDRGLGKIGAQLSEEAKVYGESNIYVGDDGKLYL